MSLCTLLNGIGGFWKFKTLDKMSNSRNTFGISIKACYYMMRITIDVMACLCTAAASYYNMQSGVLRKDP